MKQKNLIWHTIRHIGASTPRPRLQTAFSLRSAVATQPCRSAATSEWGLRRLRRRNEARLHRVTSSYDHSSHMLRSRSRARNHGAGARPAAPLHHASPAHIAPASCPGLPPLQTQRCRCAAPPPAPASAVKGPARRCTCLPFSTVQKHAHWCVAPACQRHLPSQQAAHRLTQRLRLFLRPAGGAASCLPIVSRAAFALACTTPLRSPAACQPCCASAEPRPLVRIRWTRWR